MVSELQAYNGLWHLQHIDKIQQQIDQYTVNDHVTDHVKFFKTLESDLTLEIMLFLLEALTFMG